MSKFAIEYVIEAEDLSEAGRIAHENIYVAEVDVEQVRVKAVDITAVHGLRTFNEPALKAPTVKDIENLGNPYGE